MKAPPAAARGGRPRRGDGKRGRRRIKRAAASRTIRPATFRANRQGCPGAFRVNPVVRPVPEGETRKNKSDVAGALVFCFFATSLLRA